MNKFQQLLKEAGYEPHSYSGRGMLGKTCLGVDLKGFNCLGDFIADVIEHMTEDSSLASFCSLSRQIEDAFRSMQTDSMGKGIVVYFTDSSFDEGRNDEDRSTQHGDFL